MSFLKFVICEYYCKSIIIDFYEIFKIVNKLKLGKSPGEDGINNIFLRNLAFDYMNKFMLRLINLSLKNVPLAWKIRK